MKDSVREIGDGLFMFTLPMPFRLKHVNVFAALKGTRVTLIDTGPNVPEVLAELEKCLQRIGTDFQGVEQVLITHFHTDHCGLAGLVKEKSGAAIRISETDFEMIGSNELRRNRAAAFYREQGLDQKAIETAGRVSEAIRSLTYPFEPDEFLSPEKSLDLPDRSIRILRTPGHTPGHLCFFFPEDEILIAGDCVLPHITPNLSPDVLNPLFFPLQEFVESLDRVAELPAARVYPAHGLPFQNLRKRVEEIKKHHRVKEKVYRAVKKSRRPPRKYPRLSSAPNCRTSIRSWP